LRSACLAAGTCAARKLGSAWLASTVLPTAQHLPGCAPPRAEPQLLTSALHRPAPQVAVLPKEQPNALADTVMQMLDSAAVCLQDHDKQIVEVRGQVSQLEALLGPLASDADSGSKVAAMVSDVGALQEQVEALVVGGAGCRRLPGPGPLTPCELAVPSPRVRWELEAPPTPPPLAPRPAESV
jgi:hypothetical protein